MNKILRFPAAILVIALALAVSGCGRVAPTSPDVALESTTGTSGDGARSNAPPAMATLPESGDWTFIQDPTRPVLPGLLRFLTSVLSLVTPAGESQIATGKWSLQFHSGSLSLAKLISIAQASDGTMRVQFGPDGTKFGTAVDLTVSYAGTSLDPASSSYVPGTTPVFLYFDPALKQWTEVASINDPAHKLLHVKLQHFSTYGVGGRAGW